MKRYEAKRAKEELIQAMAVACAALETMEFGRADSDAVVYDENGNRRGLQSYAILDKVMDERIRQDARWGKQFHNQLEWAMILAEEIGEWAEQVRKITEICDMPDAMEADDVLRKLQWAGEVAREWLEEHDWPI